MNIEERHKVISDLRRQLARANDAVATPQHRQAMEDYRAKRSASLGIPRQLLDGPGAAP